MEGDTERKEFLHPFISSPDPDGTENGLPKATKGIGIEIEGLLVLLEGLLGIVVCGIEGLLYLLLLGLVVCGRVWLVAKLVDPVSTSFASGAVRSDTAAADDLL